MGSGLSAFDRKFLQGVNIATDGLQLPQEVLPSRVQPSKSVTYWEDLPCNKSLEDLTLVTDLIRLITIRLTSIGKTGGPLQSSYEGVLKKIDAYLANILERYPGSEWGEKGEMTPAEFRQCNIGTVPLTDEGIEFIRTVYNLLEGREDELKAEKKRKEDELNALLNGEGCMAKSSEPTEKLERTPKEKSLWDVTYEFPMFGIRTTIRVRAEDESNAHDFTVDFFTRIAGGPTTCAKPANLRQHRKIHETTDSEWRWKPRQKTKKRL